MFNFNKRLNGKQSFSIDVRVMDPWVGKGIRPGQPLEIYRQAKEAVVAWFEL